MNSDKAAGIFFGLFIGDALGAPNEFLRPTEIEETITGMVGGGMHQVAEGEWTDDGAMALAIADSYITKQTLRPDEVALNFKEWLSSGKFGTRDYVFDVGNTCLRSVNRMTTEQPYAGQCVPMASGNGSIMRIAPCVVANHNSLPDAVADSIATALMTHGNSDTIRYTTAFVTELFEGKQERYQALRDSGINTKHGSVMHTYATAWHCVDTTTSFDDALIKAVNLGYDADTVGAVTGMLAGSIYGYNNINRWWKRDLFNHEGLRLVCSELYKIGDKVCTT